MRGWQRGYWVPTETAEQPGVSAGTVERLVGVSRQAVQPGMTRGCQGGGGAQPPVVGSKGSPLLRASFPDRADGFRRGGLSRQAVIAIVNTWSDINPCERVPADAPDKVPTGYNFWVNAWPSDPGWKFVAVGVGHDVAYWAEFLAALAEVDPDMAVNIEHEDADYSGLGGLALAAENLRAAAEKV
jgi:hypothetical protein